MYSERRRFFEATYDGTEYRQEYRIDPRMLIPGILVTVISIPLVALTWPQPMAFGVAGIGLALVGVSFATRDRFSVSKQGYHFSWSIGPIGRKVNAGPDDVAAVLSGGGHGTYRITLRCGWRRFDPLIEAASRREAEAWLEFLRCVSHGIPAAVPSKDIARPLSGSGPSREADQ
jgi:hypothetical protein